MKRFAPVALLMLCACATPQERCVSNVTQNLRVLDRLIAESRANLQRGYGYSTERRTNWQWGFCGYNRYGAFNYCFEPYDTYREVPVSLNLAEEQQRLDAMERKRAQLAKETQAQVAACNAGPSPG